MRLLLLSLSACALVLAGAPLARANDKSAALRQLVGFQFAEAAAALPLDSSDRDTRLAAALARLNAPGRPDSVIETVASVLASLVAADPADEAGLWAAFHLARIDQFHRRPARPEAALAAFRRLILSAHAHPAAQESLLRAAVLILYEPSLALPPEERIAQASALEPDVSAATRASFHMLLGRGILFHRADPAAARRHLELAQSAGLADGALRRSVWISLGELSETLGEPVRAADCYRAFLAEDANDKRTFAIREKLERLREKEGG